jgi:nicotinate-nucleotide pyrophosphorylase
MYEIESTIFDELIATALLEDLGAGDITTRAMFLELMAAVNL